MTWLRQVRLYAVCLRAVYLQDGNEVRRRPREDFRLGIDLYREWGLDRDGGSWGEFWGDCSWRRTNLYDDNYRSWVFALVPKIGVKGPIEALRPYLTGEIAIAGRSEFWQNRAAIGLGMRILPFSGHTPKVYVEGLWIVGYFRGRPPPGTPYQDVRLGITFSRLPQDLFQFLGL